MEIKNRKEKLKMTKAHKVTQISTKMKTENIQIKYNSKYEWIL